uniref:F-box domain-containing protein n=1 Tax=Parastrongyloides trichosuri TaxID=131310 RepID=A0A0N4ZDC4_PARTI
MSSSNDVRKEVRRKTIRNPFERIDLKYIPNYDDEEGNLFEFHIADRDMKYIPLESFQNLSEVENINKEAVEIYVDLERLSWDVEKIPKFDELVSNVADYIDKLIDSCSHVFILSISAYIPHFYSIISKVTSLKIRVLYYSITEYSWIEDKDLSYFGSLREFDSLINLQEFHVSIGDYSYTTKLNYMQVYRSLMKQLSKRRTIIVRVCERVFSGNMPVFEKFLNILKEYNMNFCLSNFEFQTDLFNECIKRGYAKLSFRMQNLLEINIEISDLRSLRIFVTALPFFKKLRVLGLIFKIDFFNNINNGGEDFKSYFSRMMFRKIHILRLDFDHSNIFNHSESHDHLFALMNEMAEEIIFQLDEKLQMLSLKGIPEMTHHMGNLLSRRCPHIIDIYLDPRFSIDENFVEQMKELKFISLNGVFHLNIPLNVEMAIVSSKDNQQEINKLLVTSSDDEIYNFFEDKFNRSFSYSLRICNGHCFKNFVLFNDMVQWNAYIGRMRIYF